ncbi:MAG: tetratricopeptide repeat protein, partial [Saprospiraceae bacterium]
DRLPTWLKLSEFQLIVKQHGDALSSLNQVLQRDPQNAGAFFMSGRVALDMGDTVRAVKALQRSVQYDAANADAWTFLGRIFSQRNDPLAIQYFDNALRVDSSRLEVLEYQGDFYKRTGDYTKASAVYRELIGRNPDYSNAFFDIGLIYLDQDSLNKAYDNFNIAIKTDPLFVNAYYFRGVSSEALGNMAAAYADYKQANKMSPDFKEAKEARARLEKAGMK